MDADLAETVDMLTRAIGIIERELAKSAAWRRGKGRVKAVSCVEFANCECSIALGTAHVIKVTTAKKNSAQDGLVHPERLDEEGDGRA